MLPWQPWQTYLHIYIFTYLHIYIFVGYKGYTGYMWSRFSIIIAAEFIDTLKDYEIVIPSLVDSTGAFLSHDLSHSQGDQGTRRDIKDDGDRGNIEYVDTRHYKIRLFRKELHLQLERSHRLIAPGFIFERRGRNVSESQLRQFDHTHHCHFNGHVREHRDSRVAVSTCDGVVCTINI